EMSRSGAGKALCGAKSGLVSMVIRRDMAFSWSVAERPIDKADRILSSAVAPDTLNDGLGRRMRLRHGRDMRRYDHLGMGPECVAFRQRLGVGNVQHGCCKAAAVERRDECALIELRTTSDMQQPRANRQRREQPCAEDAVCLLRQRQKA